jgi:hypothetical protein
MGRILARQADSAPANLTGKSGFEEVHPNEMAEFPPGTLIFSTTCFCEDLG